MEDDLAPGLHEALVTEALRMRIERARAAGWFVEWKSIDDADVAEMLARHLHQRARERIDGVPAGTDERSREQVRIANRVLEALAEYSTDSEHPILIDEDARVMLDVGRPGDPVLATKRPRPGIPLTTSTLLVNAHRELQIGTQLALEIPSANRIDLLCAFVRWPGVRLIRKELEDFLVPGGEMRVIASVYTGSTQKQAIDDLVGLGAKVKISYDTTQTRLHAKAWLFERASGYHTAYVGSSNLTQTALLDGLEWNVRLTAIDNDLIIERIRRTFEQYWLDPEFEFYDPAVDGDRLEQALAREATVHAPVPSASSPSETPAPRHFQVPILESLRADRDRGYFQNLVVAPTGTGKTWISAFDYQRLRRAGYERLLFIAHRDEILQQTRNIFRTVLDDPAFGARHVAGERPSDWSHVFASVQSLHRIAESRDPNDFDVIIVDEYHHAEAETYGKVLRHFTPKILLGLTATPERADGKDILHWFGDRIAYEMRLWEALDRSLLCPFHYFGIGDSTDLRAVRFERGRYVTSDLEGVLTGDHVRVARILKSVRELVLDPSRMRVLGFCAGVNHARFMAEQFSVAGYPAVALDGRNDGLERREAIERLRAGEIRAIFTVDIFNEGVDIPEVDTLLLLRPTESATVFLQQLGRGLRWSPESGKTVLTVLDFIGQANVAYRFDVRYRALIGGTRAQIAKSLEHGFPLMPPGCAIRLDEIAQEIVLENLKVALGNRRRAMADDLRQLPPETTLSGFLDETAYDLQDVYARPSAGMTFNAIRRAAGHLKDKPGIAEQTFAKAVGRLLHVSDAERYGTWRNWLSSNAPPTSDGLGSRDGRLALMLFAAMGMRSRPVADLQGAFDEIWGVEP